MRRGDRLGDRGRDPGNLVVARLDRVQDLGAPGAAAGVGFVFAGNLRVEIPAEIGEALRVRASVWETRRGDRRARLRLRPDSSHVDEGGDDVGDLHARVVQIV